VTCCVDCYVIIDFFVLYVSYVIESSRVLILGRGARTVAYVWWVRCADGSSVSGDGSSTVIRTTKVSTDKSSTSTAGALRSRDHL